MLASLILLVCFACPCRCSAADTWGYQAEVLLGQIHFGAVFPGLKEWTLRLAEPSRDLTESVIQKYSTYDAAMLDEFVDVGQIQVPIYKFESQGYALGFTLPHSEFFIFFDGSGNIKDYWITKLPGQPADLELFQKQPFRASIKGIGSYRRFAEFDERVEIEGPWSPSEVIRYVQNDKSLDVPAGLEKFSAETYPGQEKLRHYFDLRRNVLRDLRFALYLSKHLLFERH